MFFLVGFWFSLVDRTDMFKGILTFAAHDDT